MFCWRITKYDPQYRDCNDAYIKNEWTSYSDIGKTFESTKFFFNEYIKIEDMYVSTIFSFMKCLNLDVLQVISLEKDLPLQKDSDCSSLMLDEISSIKNGDLINKKLIEIITRLTLREKLWCKLEVHDMYVHFGYDYYMYIGSSKACKSSIIKIEKWGLFVESYESPYLINEA